MRARLATGLFVASALLMLMPAAAWLTRPPTDVGRVPGTVIPDVAAADLEASTSKIGTGVRTSPQAVVVRSARLSDLMPLPRGPRPIGLTIQEIGVRAPIVPVGVEPGTRNAEVPDDVDDVGWYRFGPRPGASGSAVLLGHVDSRVQGPGAFFRLRELAPGDIVRVGFSDGTHASFEIVGRRSYPKEQLPASIFRRGGSPVLTLITCGGSFSEAIGRYADNVVVFAIPIE